MLVAGRDGPGRRMLQAVAGHVAEALGVGLDEAVGALRRNRGRRQDELIELGMLVGDVQVELVVGGDLEDAFQLQPFGGRLLGVVGHRAERALRLVRQLRHLGDLEVLVVVIIGRQIDLGAVVEEAVLRAELVGGQIFRLIGVVGRSVVIAARLIAGAGRGIERIAGLPLPIQIGLPIDPVRRDMSGVGKDIGDHRFRVRGVVHFIGRAIARLVVVGAAQAEAQLQTVGDTVIGLTEGCPRIFLHDRLDETQPQTLHDAVGEVEIDVVMFLIIEEPGHPLQRGRIVGCSAEFLGKLIEAAPESGDFRGTVGRRVVAVRERVAVVDAVGGDRGQFHQSDIVVNVERSAAEGVVQRPLRIQQIGAAGLPRLVDDGERHLAGADAAGVIIIGAETDREILVRRIERLEARADILRVVGVLGDALRDILIVEIPGMILGAESGAHRQIVRDRNIRHALGVDRTVIAEGDRGIPGIFLRRIVGDDVHRAGGGVAAIQRSLRTAQHFDAVDIVEGAAGAARTAVIDAIDIEGDSRIADLGVVGAADATDEDFHRIAVIADLQGRHGIRQGQSIVDAGILQRIAGQGGDRDRHVLRAFGSLLGGHYHLVDAGGRRRLGVRGGAEREKAASDQNPATLVEIHHESPFLRQHHSVRARRRGKASPSSPVGYDSKRSVGAKRATQLLV